MHRSVMSHGGAFNTVTIDVHVCEGLLAFSAIYNAVLDFGKGLSVRLCRGCVAKNGIAGFGMSLFNHYPLTFQSSWIRFQPSYPLVTVCGKYTTQ